MPVLILLHSGHRFHFVIVAFIGWLFYSDAITGSSEYDTTGLRFIDSLKTKMNHVLDFFSFIQVKPLN